MANGRAGRADLRGNNRQRHARKMYLLNRFGAHYSAFGGCFPGCQGTTCWVAQCHECSTLVTYQTMMVDRIKMGCDGGRYTRDNIQIHCPTCSHQQGQTVMRQRMAQ